MKLNRRNVLVGLGTIVAGGGAALGTGAFSTVKAERSVTVNTSGDADALLALDPSGDGDNSDIVDLESGLLVIDFGEAGTEDAEGVNLDALTTVGKVDTDSGTVDREALTITNNGSQTVDVKFEINFHDEQDITANPSDILKLWTDANPDDDPESDAYIGDSDSEWGNLVAETLTLDEGDTANIALQIDTTEPNDSGIDIGEPLFDTDATITADSVDSV